MGGWARSTTGRGLPGETMSGPIWTGMFSLAILVLPATRGEVPNVHDDESSFQLAISI